MSGLRLVADLAVGVVGLVVAGRVMTCQHVWLAARLEGGEWGQRCRHCWRSRRHPWQENPHRRPTSAPTAAETARAALRAQPAAPPRDNNEIAFPSRRSA